jgi:N-acetylmuramoyl-L-alanine amidase
MRVIERPSPNFDARSAAVDLVVLHYTGMQSAEVALARLCDPAPVAGRYPGPWQADDIDPRTPLGRASAHYVVDEAGIVFRLVDEAKRAWHAGVSSWEGVSDNNSRSIGIEIVNGGHDFGLPDFPDAQIEAVIALLKDILTRHGLSPSRVVGHSDVASGRKLDPGEKFPWKRLADAGVSIWPDTFSALADSDPMADLQRRLALFGYNVAPTGLLDEATAAALVAFQRRFRPDRMTGALDAETQGMLVALTR